MPSATLSAGAPVTRSPVRQARSMPGAALAPTPITRTDGAFGISTGCLANWMRAAEVAEGARDGVTREESAELRELRKRNRLLEQENEVLRKAAAYLSQGALRGK